MATVIAKDSQKRDADFSRRRTRKMLALTKSDTDELAEVPKGIFCKTAGNANVIFADDTVAVIIPLLAGTYYDFEIKQLLSTSTTADVLACY